MRVAIHTLGCKVNQYESQAMEELLRARGHTLVPFEEQAEAYLINSCTVTATSDKKSRQAVRQVRRRAPEALVALCGCYPQVSPDQAASLGADLVGGSGDRRGFLDKLEALADLIAAVCRAAPGVRVRLGSLEPRTVTEDFCRQLAGLPNLCPHFHLSLQSGCDATLARMGRKYTAEDYRQTVARLAAWFDRPAVTTDLIVGFPGETEEDFAKSLELVLGCGLAKVHVFPYSRRQGTPAAAMPDQIPNAVKADRAHRAGEALGQRHAAWLASWVGQTIPVLFEEEKGGWWRGYGPQYMEVRVQGGDLHNQVRPVTITRADAEALYGQCQKEEP